MNLIIFKTFNLVRNFNFQISIKFIIIVLDLGGTNIPNP